MQLHEIQKNTTSDKKAKRVGRGGKRGKTSGRGHKGQNARAGNKKRPEMRDIIKKIPKLRGHGKNRSRTFNPTNPKPVVVNVETIENFFDKGAEVTPDSLIETGVISLKAGKKPLVKILGKGEITKSITVKDCLISSSAREKIEKAGGKIE